jgi:TRAP-type mannitol/chloroaromatic compound transport system substrate-binding protein
MKRRQVIKQAAIATVTTATVASCARQNTSTAVKAAMPQIKWRMATSWTKALGIFSGPDIIAKRVKEMTGGAFTITPFSGGEIVPGLQVLDAIQTGAVECGHTASYYYIGKNPGLAFATAVPFGLNAQQQNAWLNHGGGLEAMQKIYSDFNVINFSAGNTGVQMGGWFKREIKSLADLKGLKMRIPGLGGQVMTRLGVNVQVLPSSEIYISLDRGAIDAAEWVGPYDDEKLGLNKAAQFYYYPGWWEPGPSLDFIINLNAWNKLPQEYKEILKAAAKEANIGMQALYEDFNGQVLQKMLKGGTKLVPYSQEIMKAAQKASSEILDDIATKNSSFKQIYEPWKAFRENANNWNRINELSFANFVMGGDR